MAMKTIAMIGTRPAAMVDVMSEERRAMTKAVRAARAVTMQKIFTAGSVMRAASGPLIWVGLMRRPATPIVAIRAIEIRLATRAAEPLRRSGQPAAVRPASRRGSGFVVCATYFAIRKASGGIMAIM